MAIVAGKVVFQNNRSAKQVVAGPADPPRLAAQSTDDGPLPEVADTEHLLRIETKCVELVAKIRPAVVGVISPSKAAGSGVIISPHGLVLSQLHVSHMRVDANDFSNLHSPGEQAIVMLADGRECKAKLLGANRTYDLSLLQLLEPGPYPFVSLEADARARRGDWVVKLGHPMGLRADRPAPARLGRILGSTAEAFVADCRTVSGDSGGPYFDLDGRLVGIMNLADADISMHYSEGLRGDVYYMAISTARIASLLESMNQGHIPPYGRRQFVIALERITPLPVELRTQGDAQKAAVRRLGDPLRSDIVEVVNGEVPVGLGTVVDDGGYAVAKATVLPPQPQCRLPDGSIMSVDVIGVDKAFDLAVLRLPRKMLPPVKWTGREDPAKAGTVSVAIGANGAVLSFGIVSVGTRRLTNIHPPTYDLPLRVKAAAPHVSGQVSQTNGYVLNSVDFVAEAAGLKSGDRLISIAGHVIATEKDLSRSVSACLSGDIVEVVYARTAKTTTTHLPLRAAAGLWEETFRSDDFPVALEYSPPVGIDQCGGPLVDLKGQVMGITVGSSAPHAGWAIPANSVRRLVADAKAGKLGQWEPH